MAGKFLSLEEAARHLGVPVDEVNRLVDRKKLFPMRDGATVKFKLDELDRVKADLSEESAGSSDLGLGLEPPASSLAGGSAAPGGGADDILLGDAIEETESIFGADSDPRSPSQTIVRGGQPADGDDDILFDDRGSLLASDDLALESIIGASSPSLARGGQPTIGPAGSAPGSGTLSIDLSGIGSGGGGVSGPALSGAIDSGLSLEDGGLQASGIDIGGASIVGSGVDAVGGSLVGDAFELGAGGDDDESASVVIATEDTGDSSFFGTVAEDSASVSFEDSSGLGTVAPDEGFVEVPVGPPFNALQIVGLVCCTLFLLACSLVMVDLVSVIAAPAGKPVAGPLIKALADTFAWR